MRCRACNAELNDYEATRKDHNDEFLDLCNTCYKEADYDFDTTDRLDLLNEADIVYEDENIVLQSDENMLQY